MWVRKEIQKMLWEKYLKGVNGMIELEQYKTDLKNVEVKINEMGESL